MRPALATRSNPVMTGNAITNKISVINRANLRPVCGVMTAITLEGRLDMTPAFTLCNHVIMATGTHANDFIMIYGIIGYRSPGGRSRLMKGITSGG